MIRKNIMRAFIVCMISALTITPVKASAAALLKIGTKNSEVKQVQEELKEMGYFKYSKITGYYGSITARAVKSFQKANGLSADGIVGKQTRKALNNNQKDEIQSLSTNEVKVSEVPSKNMGTLDWFSKVIHIWDRGDNATIIDVNTEKTFQVKRTYGTNHADIEPLTKKDANIIKDIWGGWSWERRAVVVILNDYILAGSMTAMPHAGLDSQPSTKVVNGRSGGYGRGQNLDAVKNNGVNGVMDLHFKNSRTHGTNTKQSSHQDMVTKAAKYIKNNY